MFEGLIEALDHLRLRILRQTLILPLVRRLFLSRAQRLLVLFLLAATVYLPLSLFVPLWVLAIGPLLWGIPHIFASIRYIGYATTPRPTERRRTVYFIALVWFGISAFRVLGDLKIYSFDGFGQTTLIPEIISLLVTFSGLAFIFRRHVATFLVSALFLSPLVWLMWALPLECMGILLLAHNWIAFYYWIDSAKTKPELKTAATALAVFAGIHIAVFMGLFDGVRALWTPQINLPWAGLNALELGQSIVPWSNHEALLFHGAVLYAFGQAMHYFVWLKAIPEQHLALQTPASFARSWQLLQQDFGKTFAGFVVGGCVVTVVGFAIVGFAIVGLWSLANFNIARDLYFAFAAGHGYFELAALPLSRGFFRQPLRGLSGATALCRRQVWR